jgi:predicted amidohydrolase
MKICVAQTKPFKGDIERNIISHTKLINLAASHGAALIVFPELSITGYEPSLAKKLAIHPDDSRFDNFQKLSNSNQIAIGVGVPTKNKLGICISMLIFQPNKDRQIYSKKYLHLDEEPFFVSGENIDFIEIDKTKISFSICYELSIPQHSENAFQSGANIYIASVAKTAIGVENANKTLSAIAKKHKSLVLMSNCVGFCDDFESAGKSTIWNKNGKLLAQMDEQSEGILIFDTETEQIFQ